MAIFVEGEHAFVSHQVLNCLRIREGVFYLNIVVLLHCLEKFVGFWVEPTGIK